MVERSHGILRSAKDIDSDRLYNSGDKLDHSGMRCKQLDYIDWNDNRYDLNRLEPETLAAKVNMCHTINSCTRLEALPSNRKEATQNDRSPTGDRLTTGPASASVRPAVRKRPNVIVVEPRKTADRFRRVVPGGTESCSSRNGQGGQHRGPYGYTGPSERPELQAAVLYDVDHGLC